MQEVAKYASDDTLAAFCDARKRLHEARQAAEHAQQLEALRAELRSGYKDPAAPVRQQIEEEILTLRCPRPGCRQAFAAFDGCLAVQCSRAGCGAYFCAICTTDCRSSADAHAHARACRYGNGTYYASAAEIPHMQNVARAAKLRALLRPLDRRVAEGVLRGMAREFADVGLTFDVNALA